MRYLLSFFLACFAFFAAGQVVQRPQPMKLYNNLSQHHPDFLSSSEAAQLEEKLQTFSNETSNQLCVVIVDDLNNLEPSEYATQLLNEWGVGKADKNNGVVILLQLKPGKGGRDFIAVGYGLEGAIPDLATKRIREEELEPNLKAGAHFAALDRSTDRLMELAKGEINVKDYTRQSRKNRRVGAPFIIVFIVLFLLFGRRFRGGGGTTFSGRGPRYWGGGRGGSWGSGSGGFGGGSSGGWGGFGGGRSGGGGSGGSW